MNMFAVPLKKPMISIFDWAISFEKILYFTGKKTKFM